MNKRRSIVLLSGGMDSATTLFIAGQESDVEAVMFFDYGQRGAKLERRCSEMLASMTRQWSHDSHAALPMFIDTPVKMPMMSGLLRASVIELRPDTVDSHGLPITFVPARNLIFLSYAAAVAYAMNASLIYGGWTSVDCDYPDCRPSFIEMAEGAINEALGHSASKPMVIVRAPLLHRSKAAVVEIGSALGVPWKLTRSCYNESNAPCLECDSCLKRIEAFVSAGVRDPLVTDDKEETDETV